MVRRSSRVATRLAARPYLAVPQACGTSLRSAHVYKDAKQFASLSVCSRLESNQHRILRKDISYPLNDGS